MIIDVPFEYKVQYVPVRHRNPKTANSVTKVSVEIAHADEADVRLLHVVASSFETDGDAGPYAPVKLGGWQTRPCRIIEHGGRIYSESCLSARLQDLVMDISEKASGSPFHVHPKSGGYKHMLTVDEYPGPVKAPVDAQALAKECGGFRPGTYRDDGGKAIATLVRARAAELLVFDGSVFVPTSEPVLGIYRQPPSGDDRVWSAVLTVSEARQGGWSAFERPRGWRADHRREEVFALDRKSDAVAYARALTDGSGEPFVDGTVVEAVSQPDISFGGTWLIHRVANDLVNEMGGKVMGMAPSLAEAYAELRDACGAFPGMCSARQLRALDAFVEEVATHGIPGMPHAGECAQVALSGMRDVALEARSAAETTTLPQLIQAYAALGESERLGKSWVRSSPVLPDPVAASGLEAAEMLSSHDAARLAESLGGVPPTLQPPVGGRLVALLDAEATRSRPHGLVCLSANGGVEWSMGRDGRPVAPHAVELAASYAVEAPAEYAEEIDARDMDAFAF